MNNSVQFQFNQSTLASIQYLNSQASVVNRLDGKYMPAVNEVVTETQKQQKLIQLLILSAFSLLQRLKTKMVQTLSTVESFLLLNQKKKKQKGLTL